jgi:probable rRNA maturation factor
MMLKGVDASMLSCELYVKVSKPFRGLVDERWLRQIAEQTLAKKGIDPPVELSLVITGAKTIRRLNKRYRARDEATDVLSFALVEESPPATRATSFITPPDGVLHLGEVIVSYPQAVLQAEEYHHPLEQELALLVVHGVLHLLGHEDEEAKAELNMRAEEERILGELSRDGLLRTATL